MKLLPISLAFTTCFIFTFQLYAQVHQFQGDWTRDGTTYQFDFDLHLRHTGGNTVEGVFNWEFVRYDENAPASKSYYEEKKGATAKEYVRGTYDPNTGTYRLQGYKKDDPNRIISLDLYELKVDRDGNIGGKSRAHGTWQGKINGKGVRNDAA